MINKIIKSLFEKTIFLQREKDLLQQLVKDGDEKERSLILLQESEAREALRSQDGRIVKVQYGKKRSVLEKKLKLPLLQKESVVGRFSFAQEGRVSNFIQIIQVNGLISVFEYRYPPPLESDDVIEILDCETYLLSRIPVDPFEIGQRLNNIPMLRDFKIINPDPPGMSGEILGAKAFFPEIFDDYFAL